MAISKIENASLATSAVGQSNMGTGVAGTGPAFSVVMGSNQTSISANTPTKMAFNSVSFDTASYFDTVNYRYKPLVAGYYLFTAGVQNATGGAGSYVLAMLYKNGSDAAEGSGALGVSGSLNPDSQVTRLLYMNGSTDYVEAYTYGGSGTYTANANNAATYFHGILLRAA